VSGAGLYFTIFLPAATRIDDFTAASECAVHGCHRPRLLAGQYCRWHNGELGRTCDNLTAIDFEAPAITGPGKARP
jgi:hypothetical protein